MPDVREKEIIEKRNHPEILFIFPQFKGKVYLSDCIFTYHLGAGYILSYLKEMGISAGQFIHKEPIGLDELTKKILIQKPDIVGFTCYDVNYYTVKLISRLLKKQNPDLTIIIGGPTATFSDELIMQDNPAIDICIRGEGEYTVYELVKQLRIGRDVNHIQGITYRKNGKIIRTKDRPLISNGHKTSELDILPSPYLNNILPADEDVGILTSRGCAFKCIYCNFSALSRWTVRYHSVERVIAELKMIQKSFRGKEDATGCVIEIYDDAFSLNIDRAKHICRRIIEKKISLRFWTETRADRVDKELLRLMYKAGFWQVNFGLESAIPRILKTIKKIRESSLNENSLMPEKKFIKKIIENVGIAKEIGLDTTLSIIMGLPGATIKDDKKSVEFVRKLKVELCAHNHLTIYPGTELFKTHRKYGLMVKTPTITIPYQTIHTYDVWKIPQMKNSFQNLNRAAQIERVLKLTSGDYAGLNGDGYPDILFKNRDLDNRAIEWLSRSIAISPIILFIKDGWQGISAHKDIKSLVDAGLPIASVYLLTQFNKKKQDSSNQRLKQGGYKLTFHTETLYQRGDNSTIMDSLEFIPFSDYNRSNLSTPDKKWKDVRRMILSLSDLDDIGNLGKLAVSSKKVVLENRMTNIDCHFLDECRWLGKDCPASRFRRAIINKDSSIATCFNGSPIAEVGDNREDIIDKISLLWQQMKKKRGCDNCPVRDDCSKCLFPYPMESREYCRIRRKERVSVNNANNALGLFKIIRGLRPYYDAEVFEKQRIDRITGVFDGDLVKITIDEKEWLYHLRSDRFLKAS